jgi:monoamine oxidase
VETPRGSLRTGHVIVTASTNALNAGTIKFDPPLPKRTLDALAGLALGTRDRLIFELPGNPFGFGDEQRIVFKTGDSRNVAIVGRLGGTDLAYADFCGRFGIESSNSGDAAMKDFVAETLAAHFGAESKKRIGRSDVMRWSREPWILGATSAAAPGSGNNRRVLAEPIHDRILLAGEALHESWWGTVAGAWVSGERSADAVLRRIEASQKAAPAKKK